jgi:hypothetical protein
LHLWPISRRYYDGYQIDGRLEETLEALLARDYSKVKTCMASPHAPSSPDRDAMAPQDR